MLKNGAGKLVNNTAPGNITTGTLSGRAPGGAVPVPPFPNSTFITSVSFGAVRWWSGQGDTWPTAQLASGETYGWDCDNNNGAGETPSESLPDARRRHERDECFAAALRPSGAR
jgi:hypothetical protein